MASFIIAALLASVIIFGFNVRVAVARGKHRSYAQGYNLGNPIKDFLGIFAIFALMWFVHPDANVMYFAVTGIGLVLYMYWGIISGKKA